MLRGDEIVGVEGEAAEEWFAELGPGCDVRIGAGLSVAARFDSIGLRGLSNCPSLGGADSVARGCCCCGSGGICGEECKARLPVGC